MLAHTNQRRVPERRRSRVDDARHDFRISDRDDQAVDPKIDHVTWELERDREGRLLLLHGEGNLRAARVHRARADRPHGRRIRLAPSSAASTCPRRNCTPSSGSASSPRARAGTPASSAASSWNRWPACRRRPSWPASCATATRWSSRTFAVLRRVPVGRDRGHALRDARDTAARRHGARHLQRRRLDHSPRERRRRLRALRTGDRRGVDQGLHEPARGLLPAHPVAWPACTTCRTTRASASSGQLKAVPDARQEALAAARRHPGHRQEVLPRPATSSSWAAASCTR